MIKNNRITKTFTQLVNANQKAFIPFITAGDPTSNTEEIMHTLVEGGANLIELGIPFSDPVADGPAIQAASERAIKAGISCRDCLKIVASFRETNKQTAIILMGYMNTCEVYTGGFKQFSEDASQAGVDGIILVDLSYESGRSYRNVLTQNNIIPIQLISPTTSDSRIKMIVSEAQGFVYYVSMRGTTGSDAQLNTTEIANITKKIKQYNNLPVCVGFGINDGKTAKQIAQFSDGVVVGSALVKNMYNSLQQNKDVLSQTKQFISEISNSINS